MALGWVGKLFEKGLEDAVYVANELGEKLVGELQKIRTMPQRLNNLSKRNYRMDGFFINL